jgi:hypothetical protein
LARRVVLNSSVLENEAPLSTGDFTSYYNTQSHMIKAGYYIANDKKSYVLDRVTDQLYEINASQVIEAVEIKEPGYEVPAAIKQDLNKVTDYFRKTRTSLLN